MINALKARYPQGAYGGQCIAWLHKFISFPYLGIAPNGNDVNLKFKFVRSQGQCFTFPNIEQVGKGARVGDIIFTTEGAYKNWLGNWKGAGHGAVITGIDDYGYSVAESNWNKDERITYGRVIPKNSDKIIGIGRYPITIPIEREIGVSVLINNQKWASVGVFDRIRSKVSEMTNGAVKLNFYPVYTNFKNWWYSTYPISGYNFKMISYDYIKEYVLPLDGKDICVMVIRPDEWQGDASEIAWTIADKNIIQISTREKTKSPWYDMPLIEHAFIHELGHILSYINGFSDTVHITDNEGKQIENILNGFDYNRIKANI